MSRILRNDCILFRTFAILLLFSLFVNGCFAYKSVKPEDSRKIKDEQTIYKVEKKNGEVIFFDKDSRITFYPDSLIMGYQDTNKVLVSFEEIERIYTLNYKAASASGAILFGAFIVGGILYLIISSLNSIRQIP